MDMINYLRVNEHQSKSTQILVKRDQLVNIGIFLFCDFLIALIVRKQYFHFIFVFILLMIYTLFT